ncbi:DUF6249 domain-containing protein [Hyphococcus luteus]|uniref:DUF6249 domain-containing protein n=1 Tax=Hyphococcus luteus TaxID=2058213 RepID=A0A2S7K6G3_9PROT|nr:DUF6249 domain-containing protein [Marinicaulis flavus]PQA88082.1 hypothetical protein CW354_07080 [Marinicaulis flavus]
MEVAIIVPLIVFASIVLIVGTPFYFHHRNRRVIYEAIKTSVEKTGEADPKLIAAITTDAIGPNADLRRGLLLVSLGAALAVIGALSEADMIGAPLWTVGLLPGLPGLAYIVFHFFVPREATV